MCIRDSCRVVCGVKKLLEWNFPEKEKERGRDKRGWKVEGMQWYREI